MHSPTSSTAAASTPVTAQSLSRLLDVYTREHDITRKVLHAFPESKADLQPSERSSPARKLAWTFVAEERMMAQALRGEPIKGFAPPPETWAEILESFDRLHEEVVAAMRKPNENATTVRFYVAPKQQGDIPLRDFLWFMLHDQIHHRGQLSVYVRLAGGRVPSIYGPSADEPWT